MGFLDGPFHILRATVIEDAEAENRLEAFVGERQAEHGSLRERERGAGFTKALVSVSKAYQGNIHATRRKSEFGGQLGVASGPDSDVQETRRRGIDQGASRDQEADD